MELWCTMSCCSGSQGSPKVTAAVILPVMSDDSDLAALCTSMAPCEYPETTTFVSGHLEKASWTKLALRGC